MLAVKKKKKNTPKLKIQNYLQKEKHLGVNLTKHVQNLYVEDYITLIKGFKDLNKLGHILCSWIHIQF